MSDDFSDLAAVVDSLGHTVTLIEPSASVLGSDGFWRDTGQTETSVLAVSWPSTGKEIAQAPQGESVTDMRTFAVSSEISAGDSATGTEADRIREDGVEYRVLKVAPWKIGSFYVAICVAVDE